MQFIKNITSKDIKLSQNTISDLISSKNIENFKLLAQHGDFIFSFIKDRITKDFVKLVNKNNIETVLKFTKVYSADFEEMIVKSLLKFADENLTDEILELFENGTQEQKAYCAKYFCHIKDTLALNCLYQNVESDFEPLKINCILALKAFEEKDIVLKAKDIIQNSEDDFEKLDYFLILSIFNEINFIVKNGLSSPFSSNIVSTLLDYNDFNSIKNAAEKEEIKRILHILIENYPENISLDTVLYYQALDYIKAVSEFDDNYSKNILLLAKAKFQEFSSKDIYSFDFDKAIKQEIKNISGFLDNLNLTKDEIIFEYNSEKSYQFNVLLDVIQEYKIEKFDNDLAQTFNKEKINYEFLARIAEILQSHNKIHALDKNVIENIENYNVKTLILSYL